MKIRTPFTLGDVAPTCPGNEFEPTYKRVDHEDGSWSLKEVGRINNRERINSARPASIADIISHARRGDDTLLNAKTGAVYEDVSAIPGDFGDCLAVGKRNLALLTEVREKIKAERQKSEAEKKDEVNPDGVSE